MEQKFGNFYSIFMNGILHTESNVELDINVLNYEENMKLH